MSIDKIGSSVNQELTLYQKNLIAKIKEITKDSAAELVEETKATAPVGKRRSKHYRDSITAKKTSETNNSITYTWYVNGTNYRLTHLLNNGHQLRDGGRYSGTKFLTKAVDKVIPEYEEKIQEACRS